MALLAKRLGLSTSTVSRAFSRPDLVRPETAERILETAAQLGFRPNLSARSLATGQTGLVGLVVHHGADYLSNFYARFRNGIEEELAERGLGLLQASFGNSAGIGILDPVLAKASVDGVIVVPTTLTDEQQQQLVSARIPTVIAGLHVHDIPNTHCDHFRIGYAMARHLIELGHQRIGLLLGPTTWANSKQQAHGVFAALEEAGLHLPPHYRQECRLACGFDDAYENTPNLFSAPGDPGPTAVIAASDDLAAGVYRAARRIGRGIPDDLSVIGCDDSFFCRYLSPPLTSIDQNPTTMGKRAVKLLFEADLNNSPIPFQLKLRESTTSPTR